MMSEGSKPGGLVWSITPTGAITFDIRQSTAKRRLFGTPVVFTNELLGQWVQLGLCVDEAKSEMNVYVNGDKIYVAKLSKMDSVDLNTLDVGSWKLENNVGKLKGAIGNIVVFDRALELQKIRNFTITLNQ